MRTPSEQYDHVFADNLISSIGRSKAKLLEKGHTKFALIEDDGRVCLVGSYDYSNWNTIVELDSILAHLAVERGYNGGTLTSPSGLNTFHYSLKDAHIYFNNHPDTTINDVLALLDDAILYVKEHIMSRNAQGVLREI